MIPVIRLYARAVGVHLSASVARDNVDLGHVTDTGDLDVCMVPGRYGKE